MAIIDNIIYALTAYYDDPLEYVAKIDSFVVVTLKNVNPFMPKVFSHAYQLD